jgi:hypothetical protein
VFFSLIDFRSLNLEQEAQTKQLEKDKERATLTGITTPSVPSEPSIYSCKYSSSNRLDSLTLLFFRSDVQTLDTMQALCLPLGASVSLLVMFFFFDSMQLLFAVCTASESLSLLFFFLFSPWIDKMSKTAGWSPTVVIFSFYTLFLISFLLRSYRHGSSGIPITSHVSVSQPTVHFWNKVCGAKSKHSDLS